MATQWVFFGDVHSPRQHAVRYFGFRTPNSKLMPLVVPKPLKPNLFARIFPTMTRFKVSNSPSKSPEPPRIPSPFSV